MTPSDVSDAVEASHQALAAIIRGDVEPFPALYSDAEDIAIGNPFGPFAVGRDGTRAAGTRAASNYSDGEILGFDRVATHVTDDLARVVEVERFSAKLADAPQVASIALRVTSVYRREGDARASSTDMPTRSPPSGPPSRSPLRRAALVGVGCAHRGR